MPSNWAMIDNSFPTFTGNESARVMIGELQNYLMLLVEQLKYQLNNLNATNWNETALKELQDLTTEGVETEVTNLVGDLANAAETLTTIADRLQKAETAIAYLEKLTGEQATAITGLEKRVDDAEADLNTLFAVIQPDGSGGAQIGAAEKEIRLVGKVYINGVLIEGGNA